MQGGSADPFGECKARRYEKAFSGQAIGLRRNKKARPWNRCEGDGNLQLGIVASAGPVIGIGKRVIENVLTAAVRLHVKRHRRLDGACGIFQ